MLYCSILSSSWHYSSSPWFLVKVCGLRVNLICFSSIPDFSLSCLLLAVVPLKKRVSRWSFPSLLLCDQVLIFSSLRHMLSFLCRSLFLCCWTLSPTPFTSTHSPNLLLHSLHAPIAPIYSEYTHTYMCTHFSLLCRLVRVEAWSL